jgi:CRISPR-associated protein Cas1
MVVTIEKRGAYLHVKDGGFEVRVTDPETKINESREFAAIKVKTFVLAPGTMLSSDAVELALKHHIDMVFTKTYGQPIGRIWHSQLGSTSKISKQQLGHALDQRAIPWVKKWIETKLANQRDFIQDLKRHRMERQSFFNDKIAQIDEMRLQIEPLMGAQMREIADSLRGYEGNAGRAYWEAISEALPEEHRFKERTRRPAQDLFNACLNFGYWYLQLRVEKVLIIAGLHPHIGFFHRDDYNYKSMVYDFIEPYRIWVEIPVFRLFSGKKINQNHAQPLHNGMELSKEGRTLLLHTLAEHWEEDTVKHLGVKQHRTNILQLDAHAFANQLLEQSK